MSDSFSFEIKEKYGVLSESKSGWKVELTSVEWSGRPAKYDIRSWSPDGQKMGKGITFTKDELINLKEILNNMDL